MKVLIIDFEVFKHDTLLGVYIINNDNSVETKQMWNLNEIRQFYQEHSNDIWVGHNIANYDALILQAIVQGMNEEQVKAYSNKVIAMKYKPYPTIKLNYYDTMANLADGYVSLKVTEALDGKNISETKVNFNVDKKLDDNEKLLVESYNRDDIDQTMRIFTKRIGDFELRLQMINEFKLPMTALHLTKTQIGEMVLHAKKTPGIETWEQHIQLYSNLRLSNQEIKDFFFTEKYKNRTSLNVQLCGVTHSFGIGGLHGAQTKVHYDKALYVDVSGYYNLVMIKYDLLPRSIEHEYEHLYEQMYYQQLEFKKTAPEKRAPYKIVLLSVFGGMFNEHCKFYDPYRASIVTATGQLFIADLLEKLEGKVELIQTNTDGIMVVPLPGIDEQVIFDIFDEWQQRTGFVLKVNRIYNHFQRDVNNFCNSDYPEVNDFDNEVMVRGDLKNCWAENYLYSSALFRPKESQILSVATVNFLMTGKKPEETIEEKKHILRLFQFLLRSGTYSWMEYETSNIITNETNVEVLQHINRAFVQKDKTIIGRIYKCKEGKRVIFPSLADSVFVYNYDINSEEAFEKLVDKIDWQWYIDRSYEKVAEFIPQIGDILI